MGYFKLVLYKHESFTSPVSSVAGCAHWIWRSLYKESESCQFGFQNDEQPFSYSSLVNITQTDNIG